MNNKETSPQLSERSSNKRGNLTRRQKLVYRLGVPLVTASLGGAIGASHIAGNVENVTRIVGQNTVQEFEGLPSNVPNVAVKVQEGQTPKQLVSEFYPGLKGDRFAIERRQLADDIQNQGTAQLGQGINQPEIGNTIAVGQTVVLPEVSGFELPSSVENSGIAADGQYKVLNPPKLESK